MNDNSFNSPHNKQRVQLKRSEVELRNRLSKYSSVALSLIFYTSELNRHEKSPKSNELSQLKVAIKRENGRIRV